jgi:hypothetical protein
MVETGIELPLSFKVPEAFTPVDFGTSPEVNTDRLLDRLETVDPALPAEQIAHAVVTQQTMYELLAAAGAVYAGTLLYGPSAEEPGRHLSSVVLTVTARPSELADEQTVRRLSRTLAALYPDAEVGVVRLAAGPAVLVTEERRVEKPVNLCVNDTGPTVVRQLHAFVPVPGRLAMADFAIATEDTAHWDACVRILAEVCRTIVFTEG